MTNRVNNKARKEQ